MSPPASSSRSLFRFLVADDNLKRVAEWEVRRESVVDYGVDEHA